RRSRSGVATSAPARWLSTSRASTTWYDGSERGPTRGARSRGVLRRLDRVVIRRLQARGRVASNRSVRSFASFSSAFSAPAQSQGTTLGRPRVASRPPSERLPVGTTRAGRNPHAVERREELDGGGGRRRSTRPALTAVRVREDTGPNQRRTDVGPEPPARQPRALGGHSRSRTVRLR